MLAVISLQERRRTAWRGPCPSLGDDHGRTVTEQPLVGGDADGRALDLAGTRLATELQRELDHLGDRLGGDRLPEAGQPAARVDRDAAPNGRRAGPQQVLRLALLAQPDALVPVELER